MKTFAPFAASVLAFLAAPAMADSFGVRIVDDKVSIRIGIGTPPPAPYEYAPPRPPGTVWTPGYWNWDGYRYAWVQGRWIAAAPPPVVYAPPPTFYAIVPNAPHWSYHGYREPRGHFDRGQRDWGHRPHGGMRDR